MLWLVLLIFLSAFLLIYGVVMLASLPRQRLMRRVSQVMSQPKEANFPTFRLAFNGLYKKLNAWLIRLLPIAVSKKMEIQLKKAGFRTNTAIRQFVMMRIGVFACGFIAALLLCLLSPSAAMFFVASLLMLLSIFMPRLFLLQKTKQRQKEMFKGLPNLLDMLTVSVEAGLGFDQALARTVQHMDTPLGVEMRQVLAEMTLGKTRREALKDAAARIDVDDVRSFIHALIQADRLGMGIAHVLSIQSEEARRKLRQRAEEQAMKAPIKILFPLIMFVFPGLFVVILGPAVLHMVKVFMH